MSNTLYLECNAGISGDMTVAALLDLGASQTVLMDALHSIPVKGFSVQISRVKKAGIACCDFSVLLDEEHENHDHDMEYLHGHSHNHEHSHEQEHPHDHEHDHNHEHPHDHDHEHEHPHGHGHLHRGIHEIREIIDSVHMTENAKKIASDIFEIIAKAEAEAHEVPIDAVHFHEVGAVDSIVDVVAVAVCLDDLHIDTVIVPKLCEGMGTVRCQHGVLPIPVPAVANIVKNSGLHLEIMPVQGEFVTPTGAAIVAAVKTSDQLPKTFQIKKIGMGAGKRNYERPSILRAMLITPNAKMMHTEEEVYRLETNIDDCSGEVLGYVMELLFEAGARDVHYYPVFMKKNRPAWQLNVICMENEISALEEIIFRETTTIGIRRIPMKRTVLDREQEEVQTSYGNVLVKVCHYEDMKKYYPEYESVKRLSKATGTAFQDIYQEAIHQCKKRK